MKTVFIIIITTSISFIGVSQETGKSIQESVLALFSQNACNCIDSIDVYDKAKPEISAEINKCIDDQVLAYQFSSQLLDADVLKQASEGNDIKKDTTIYINEDKNSKEYQDDYYELERYLMNNCSAIKLRIAVHDKQSTNSLSQHPKALDLYSKGIGESENENYKKAIDYFEKAIKIDPQFAFAWDNIGLCYRKLEDYDKAIEAYKTSLKIDPNGLMPLQNIAVAYQYKQEFDNAIAAYEKLTEIDPANPEVYYGIGNIYANFLKDYEKGLTNMCKAYNLYVKQNSPYRTDAEKLINIIYARMKQSGKEDIFNAILKANNIAPN